MLLDARQRKLRFHNNNGFIEDPKNEHKERQNVNIWSDHEVEIFKEKYLLHPKNFGFISSFLEKKVSEILHSLEITIPFSISSETHEIA